MQFLKLLLLASTLATVSLRAQENYLLIHTRAPIRFDKVTAATIKDAVNVGIKLSDARIKKIAAINANARTVANTLMAFDELQYDLNDLGMKLGLLGVTYVDDSTRNVANDEAGTLSEYANNLLLNESLYRSLKEFSVLKNANSLMPDEKKYLKETLIAFEKNGMKLDAPEGKTWKP